MLKKRDIVQAAKAFDSNRYPLDFYQHHLNVLKKAKSVSQSVRTSVRELFQWRMGKIRNTKLKVQLSDSAKPTTHSDADGNRYYASAVTQVTERAIHNAFSEEVLKRGFAFRDGHLSFGELAVTARKNRPDIHLSALLFCPHLATRRVPAVREEGLDGLQIGK